MLRARKPEAVEKRLNGSERADVFRTTKDYSYRSTRFAGQGWVLCGDAFGFLDPIYSSGLQLAFRSGSMAADAVHDGLINNDLSAAKLGAWGPDFLKGMDRIRKLVWIRIADGYNRRALAGKHVGVPMPHAVGGERCQRRIGTERR